MHLIHYLKASKKYLIPLFVLSISVYALYIRLDVLSRHALWENEYFQLETMNGSVLDLLRMLPSHEFCSYLSGDYYLIYPFFKMFSYNTWGLTIPHIISTILGFLFLYLISKRYFKTIWGYLVTFSVVCFNATLILHATEIRTYAVLPTLALATFYFSQELIDLNIAMAIKKKFAIGAFFILAIWFHLYGLYMLFSSLMFFLLIKTKDKSFKVIVIDLIKFLSVVLCIAMPVWLISIFGPHLRRVWAQNLEQHTFQYIPNPLYNFIGFLKGIFGNLVGYKKLYFLLIGAIFPFIMRYKGRSQQILFLFIIIFIPLGLIFLGDVLYRYWFIQRQFIWLMPLFAFYLGWTWDSVFEVLRKGYKK